MEYVIFGSITIVVIWLFWRSYSSRQTKSKYDEIRSLWGKSKPESAFNFSFIDRYANLSLPSFHRLSDQTLSDIDFQDIFKFIDRTTSKIGQQYLYKKVIEPSDNTEHPHEKLITLFRTNIELREKVQIELLQSSGNDAYQITSLLEKKSIEKPRWHKLLVPGMIIVVASIIITIVYPSFLLLLLILLMFNMFLHLWNKRNTMYFSASIPELYNLVNISKALMNIKEFEKYHQVPLSIMRLKSFQKKVRRVRFQDSQFSFNPLEYVSDFFKAIFLIEIFYTFKIMDDLKDKSSSILVLFEFVGNIDACCSVASLRDDQASTCHPTFATGEKKLKVEKIYHPLIAGCVKNDLEINGKSILITGSNMSGKSTFLRTILINSILAQTIYTCFADKFETSLLKQYSSIRIDDNVFEGKSYYFEEVSVMGSLVEAVVDGQNLFILDEVFKGTNTIERISAGKALLSYLNEHNNLVMVATHDIELVDMLSAEYDLYHFAEIVENDKLSFDHLIKKGKATSKNALKLLEIAGFPKQVIDEAYRISDGIIPSSLRSVKE